MQHVLAFDTATAHGGAALLCADGRSSVHRQRVTTHSESLLQLAESCLHDCHVRVGELGGIACSAGPGSFTGLRIGMATAKGLCFALGLPLCTISSLETLARSAYGPALQHPTLAILDAFRGQLFARLLPPAEADSPGAVQRVFAAVPQLAVDAMWQPADLVHAVQSLAGAFQLCGVDPLPASAQPLVDVARSVRLDGGATAAACDLRDGIEPPPLALARLAQDRLRRGQRADLYSAAPNYLCGSAPEEAERQRLLANQTL